MTGTHIRSIRGAQCRSDQQLDQRISVEKSKRRGIQDYALK